MYAYNLLKCNFNRFVKHTTALTIISSNMQSKLRKVSKCRYQKVIQRYWFNIKVCLQKKLRNLIHNVDNSNGLEINSSFICHFISLLFDLHTFIVFYLHLYWQLKNWNISTNSFKYAILTRITNCNEWRLFLIPFQILYIEVMKR